MKGITPSDSLNLSISTQIEICINIVPAAKLPQVLFVDHISSDMSERRNNYAIKNRNSS